MRLPRNLSDAVSFAKWCQREQQEPTAVARLLVLAKRYRTALERSTWDSSTSSRYIEQSEKWARAFEEAAKDLGYETDQSTIWPTLRRNGCDVHLPDVSV
jgi:hypothetical protein